MLTRRRTRAAKPSKPSSKPSPATLAAALELVRAWGRQGGKVGGKARWTGVTAEERSRIARAAVQARWARAKKSKPAS